MKKKMSTIEVIGVVFLIILAIGASWYLFFYKPLQENIASLNNQASDYDNKIKIASAQVAKYNAMQAELDEIFEKNPNPSEIAPYDNSQAVMNQLYEILLKSEAKDYSVKFSNASTDKQGIVRRSINMSFKCADYDHAKQVILDLEKNHWRCIVNSFAFSGNNSESNLYDGEVSVSATLVFFESTKLEAAKAEVAE